MSTPEPLKHPNPGGQRPVERIGGIVAALAIYWQQHPDMRLTQVLGNLTPAGTDAYFVEDAFIEHRLRNAIDPAMPRRTAARDLSGHHLGHEFRVEDATGMTAARWQTITGLTQHRGLTVIAVDENGTGEAVHLRPSEVVTLRLPAAEAPAA